MNTDSDIYAIRGVGRNLTAAKANARELVGIVAASGLPAEQPAGWDDSLQSAEAEINRLRNLILADKGNPKARAKGVRAQATTETPTAPAKIEPPEPTLAERVKKALEEAEEAEEKETPSADSVEALWARASAEGDPLRRANLYAEASRLIQGGVATPAHSNRVGTIAPTAAPKAVKAPTDPFKAALAKANGEPDPMRRAQLFAYASRLLGSGSKAA